MTAESELEIRIRSIGTGGEGVGSLPDGRTCFVHRTAPGDRVLVEIIEDRSRWARGRLIRVLEPGPGRVEPPCPFYGVCGGCALQHLDYPTQLEAKGSIVAEALRRVGGLEVPQVGVHPSPAADHYRNRASFSLRRLPQGRVVAGFRQLHQPARIVDLKGPCLLLEGELPRIWLSLREAWGPGAKSLPNGRELRLTLRSVAGGAILLVQGGRGAPGDPEGLVARVEGLKAIWWAPKGEGARFLAGGEEAPEGETGSGEAGIPMAPSAFIQVNKKAAETLRRKVFEAIGDPSGLFIVDAYCGVGAIGRDLAVGGATVVGIEMDRGAADAARGHPHPRFEIREGRVERLLGQCPPSDVILVNPPRTGLDPAVVDQLLATPPPRLIYVSCDPATLARDSRRLDSGFRLSAVDVVDMFPQTAQMETVAVFDGLMAKGS